MHLNLWQIINWHLFAPEFVDGPEFVADAGQKTSNYLAPEYVGPEFVVDTPEFVGTEFVAAPEFVAPEYVAPEYVAPEFVAPEFVAAPEFVDFIFFI